MLEKIKIILSLIAIVFVGSVMISILLDVNILECTRILMALFILVFMVVCLIEKLIEWFEKDDTLYK